MQMFSVQANETFSNITKIIGTFEVGNNGESTLDIQYISALAPGGENWYITIEDGWQYEFALELFNMADAPWINSVSYGWPEQKSCQSGITHANCKGLDSKTYVERGNVEFQKIGTRGISVIVCSQDEGAPSEANEGCELDSTHPLWPIYPSSSPWVTTVSATTVIDGVATSTNSVQPQPPICSQYECASGTLEYPCMINNTLYTWTTGGGFSAFAPRPSYQATAVQQWLSSSAIIPPEKFFNSSNRGYPDIAGLGSRILIIQSGAVAVTAGTSASTPIIAAIMALLNDYRFQQGKPSLGFLNPLLYQMAAEAPQTFKTIPVGNNQGTIGVECTYGYGAGWGWDPVTGLGTPNFGEMITYIDNNLP
jgi:tripeptidyl-peptidase-1